MSLNAAPFAGMTQTGSTGVISAALLTHAAPLADARMMVIFAAADKRRLPGGGFGCGFFEPALNLGRRPAAASRLGPLAKASNSINRSRSGSISLSGNIFGPSEGARSGS